MALWAELTWLCIDTETTGIDPVNDRIVELAAVRFERGEVVRRMGMLINPGIPIPEDATAIHGIRNDDVATAPSLAQVKDRFLSHVREADVLVGYNWPFDAAFLQTAIGEGWSEAISGKPVIDALVVVRFDAVGRFWKGPGRHKLGAVAEQLGIAREGKAHRASSDCVLTCRILWNLREHLPEEAQQAADRVLEERDRQDRDFQAWRRSSPKSSAT